MAATCGWITAGQAVMSAALELFAKELVELSPDIIVISTACGGARFLLCRQQSWLEDDGGRERGQKRERHQLANAGCARVMRKPQSPKGGGRRAGAEEDGARQARLQ